MLVVAFLSLLVYSPSTLAADTPSPTPTFAGGGSDADQSFVGVEQPFDDDSPPETFAEQVDETLAEASEDVSSEGETLVEPAVEPDEEVVAGFEAFIKLLSNLSFLPIAAPAVIAITALLKRFIPSTMISAGMLALVVQVVVWVAWILCKHFGYAMQFESWIDGLTTILAGVAAITVSAGATAVGYNALQRVKAPVVGQTRLPRSLPPAPPPDVYTPQLPDLQQLQARIIDLQRQLDERSVTPAPSPN